MGDRIFYATKISRKNKKKYYEEGIKNMAKKSHGVNLTINQ